MSGTKKEPLISSYPLGKVAYIPLLVTYASTNVVTPVPVFLATIGIVWLYAASIEKEAPTAPPLYVDILTYPTQRYLFFLIFVVDSIVP